MIRTTEVDGVPALVAPTAGPMTGALTFRVGQADETLARRGITHLVEHLALHRIGLSDYHSNGATAAVTTTFYAQGSATEIEAFFRQVCEGLTELPVNRLDTEKGLLRTEWAGKDRSSVCALPIWRHGAQGFGLVGFPEFGLHALDADDVTSWAQTWFTRENAVLWIAGEDVPVGLRLPLPSGSRRPVPPVTSALPTTPAYFCSETSGVVLDAIVPMSPATGIFAGLLERDLFQSLRQEGGYSYQTDVDYDPLGNGTAALRAMADAQPDQCDAVLGGMIDVLARLRVGTIEQHEIDGVVRQRRQVFNHPDAEARWLPSTTFRMLTGQPTATLDEYLATMEQVTVEQVQTLAEQATATALLMVPPRLKPGCMGFAPAPTTSRSAVAGGRYASIGDNDVTLVVGPHGVSCIDGPEYLTVRYEECAAALTFPDGGRTLIGLDGISVRVEPTLYAIDQAGIGIIDAGVPPSAVVPMPTRDSNTIPRPRQRESASQKGAGESEPPREVRWDNAGPSALKWWEGLAGGVLLVLATLMCGFFTLCTIGNLIEPPEEQSDWVAVVLGWLCLLVFLVPLGVLLRKALRAYRARR
ncbi:MAG: insulinase family protein [Dactylosporangium sp.]|nr:insulinase family protein [Dactylosporangium sp.]NNJ61417.1 insulinase family protein [Dactylosporangium sp.]